MKAKKNTIFKITVKTWAEIQQAQLYTQLLQMVTGAVFWEMANVVVAVRKKFSDPF